ncbi:hypothetical protein [Paenibacillus abyssi]|uniref:Lipoprotein n=1 Tax=Paenibacillus abyssi TaxID=1340531 RepID=A0A917CK72_9BACL|nr:hypothetical protein [Paenibacillus abyssi]GGF90257.1 hypothetical protein GCM10010916_04540 [Paenibacillus abyssi]
MKKDYGILVIIMATCIAMTIGCSDKEIIKGINSLSVSEKIEPLSGKESEKKFSYTIILKNQSATDFEIEWIEPVFQSDIPKSMVNKDLRQFVSNKFNKDEELIIENSFQFTMEKGWSYQVGENISGLNIKLKNGELIYIDI